MSTMEATMETYIAVEATLAPGFVCFTTGRDFDSNAKAPWREAAEKLEDLIARRTGISPRRVVLAGQVHGNHVVTCGAEGEALENVPGCDSLVTAEGGVFLVIRTADCVPVVLVDAEAHVCGALHAGWKGTRQNIMFRTVQAMRSIGATAGRVKGWIGPAISRANYTVSDSLVGEFLAAHGHLGAFTEGSKLDLPRLNALQAIDSGIGPELIVDSRLCTYGESKLFHSHRRQGPVRGHQFTVCGFLNGK